MSQTQLEKIKQYNDAQASKRAASSNGNSSNTTASVNSRKKATSSTDSTAHPETVKDENGVPSVIVAKASETKADRQARQDAQIEEEQNRENDALSHLADATSNIIDQLQSRANPLKDWIASQPTPGGILALCLFIGIFALAVIPVDKDGNTRLYLLYQTILNRTHMKYRETVGVGEVNSSGIAITGGSTTFGNSYTPPPTSNGATTTAPIDLTHLNLFNL